MLDIKVYDGQITENFNIKEFRCRHNGEVLINKEVIEHIYRLQRLREWYNRPININSGYRTKAYNKKVGGAVHSQHLKGIATDFLLPSEYYTYTQARKDEFLNNIKDKWLELCKLDGLGGGVGFYNSFIHVDSRPVGKYQTGIFAFWDNR